MTTYYQSTVDTVCLVHRLATVILSKVNIQMPLCTDLIDTFAEKQITYFSFTEFFKNLIVYKDDMSQNLEVIMKTQNAYLLLYIK